MISSFSLPSLCRPSPPFSNSQAVALVGKSEMGESLVALFALVTNDVITCMYAHVYTLACMHMDTRLHVCTWTRMYTYKLPAHCMGLRL